LVGYAFPVASHPASGLHDDLVRALASLRQDERRAVIAAAELAAVESRPHVVASWRSLRGAIGVVKGERADAIEDTAHLYDG
jgi:hypothetical protein